MSEWVGSWVKRKESELTISADGVGSKLLDVLERQETFRGEPKIQNVTMVLNALHSSSQAL